LARDVRRRQERKSGSDADKALLGKRAIFHRDAACEVAKPWPQWAMLATKQVQLLQVIVARKGEPAEASLRNRDVGSDINGVRSKRKRDLERPTHVAKINIERYYLGASAYKINREPLRLGAIISEERVRRVVAVERDAQPRHVFIVWGDLVAVNVAGAFAGLAAKILKRSYIQYLCPCMDQRRRPKVKEGTFTVA
jgi:hypothetical protein